MCNKVFLSLASVPQAPHHSHKGLLAPKLFCQLKGGPKSRLVCLKRHFRFRATPKFDKYVNLRVVPKTGWFV